MVKKTYYQILEVNKKASQEDIKSAYRRLAMLYYGGGSIIFWQHAPSSRSTMRCLIKIKISYQDLISYKNRCLVKDWA